MTFRLACAFAALVSSAGCATYSGGARSVDPGRFASEPGWIVAAPTPEVRQQAERDCGPAALAMVAGRWQVPLSVKAVVATLPPPSPKGTKLGDLRDSARAHGFTAFAIEGDRETLVHELKAKRPVIVGLLLPFGRKRALTHYEVIVAVHPAKGLYVTLDPAKGWRSRTWAALDAEWGPVGRPTLVVLGPAKARALAGIARTRATKRFR